MAPRALAPRQNSPPKKAGANCATAAKDRRPIWASCAGAGVAVIEIGEQRRAPRWRCGASPAPARSCRPRARAWPVAAVGAFAAASALNRRCRMSGITSPLETMMEIATHSTITMAVAADRPPTKATSATMSEPADNGSASTYMSASTEPAGKADQPGDRHRHHEQVDQHQIERKQPGAPGGSRPRCCSPPPSRGTGAAAAGWRRTTGASWSSRGCRNPPCAGAPSGRDAGPPGRTGRSARRTSRTSRTRRPPGRRRA